MKIDLLKNEAKRFGLRVTKKIKGKRVPLSEKELKMKIQRRRQPALEIQVRNSKKLIRTCKSLLRTVEPTAPRVRRVSQPVSRTPPDHAHHLCHVHHPFQLEEIHAQI